MQAGQLSISNSTAGQLDSASVISLNSAPVVGLDTASLTKKIGSLMARVFGCRHAELSRPFSRDGRAYRSCVSCGAQRQFDLGNWQMQGSFYYGKPQGRHIPSV